MAKSFEHWEWEEIDLTFDTRRLYKSRMLDELLDLSNITIHPEEKAQIERLQEKLKMNVDDWNEDEIKSFFNIPIIEIINFSAPDYTTYKTFTQRNLIGKLTNIHGQIISLNGRVELLVSRGKQKPREPFFFFNEYKPEMKGKNDPLGQLLIAMLVGQSQNEEPITLYGTYIVGQNWRFIVLEGNHYIVSQPFGAGNDNLWDIVKILKKIKMYIEQVSKV